MIRTFCLFSYPGNGTIITVNSPTPDSPTSSITDIPTFSDNSEPQGIRRMNTEASDGFSIQHNAGSNNNLLSAEQAEVPRKVGTPQTSETENFEIILLAKVKVLFEFFLSLLSIK